MSKVADTWLLPDGVEDVLPQEAARLERLRRHLLDLYASWGYELVLPPLMEFLESLLTGSGHDLELKTFKITDQLSGRMMGVRADITPQVARIDAHCRAVEHPARYCYAGTTLHTRTQSLGASRCPVQVGCELYGYSGLEADIEVLRLMLETLRAAGCRDVVLDLGHVGLYRTLVQAAGLDSALESELFDILQRKAAAELQAFLGTHLAGSPLQGAFAALIRLAGGRDVLAQAREALAAAPSAVQEVLGVLERTADAIALSHPEVSLYFDLAELRGYHYHTGLTFAAYAAESRFELAKGGRYDHVGEAFGRSRPATGFSADLKSLLGDFVLPSQAGAILAPAGDGVSLRQHMESLRAGGEKIVQLLPGQSVADAASLGCDRQLVEQAGQWQVQSL